MCAGSRRRQARDRLGAICVQQVRQEAEGGCARWSETRVHPMHGVQDYHRRADHAQPRNAGGALTAYGGGVQPPRLEWRGARLCGCPLWLLEFGPPPHRTPPATANREAHPERDKPSAPTVARPRSVWCVAAPLRWLICASPPGSFAEAFVAFARRWQCTAMPTIQLRYNPHIWEIVAAEEANAQRGGERDVWDAVNGTDGSTCGPFRSSSRHGRGAGHDGHRSGGQRQANAVPRIPSARLSTAPAPLSLPSPLPPRTCRILMRD